MLKFFLMLRICNGIYKAPSFSWHRKDTFLLGYMTLGSQLTKVNRHGQSLENAQH